VAAFESRDKDGAAPPSDRTVRRHQRCRTRARIKVGTTSLMTLRRGQVLDDDVRSQPTRSSRREQTRVDDPSNLTGRFIRVVIMMIIGID
jgi:hypothetical protein